VLDVVIFRINEEIKREGYHLHSHNGKRSTTSPGCTSAFHDEAKIPTGQKQKLDTGSQAMIVHVVMANDFPDERDFAKDEVCASLCANQNERIQEKSMATPASITRSMLSRLKE